MEASAATHPYDIQDAVDAAVASGFLGAFSSFYVFSNFTEISHKSLRDLESCVGYITQIFDFNYGSYLIEEAAVQSAIYEGSYCVYV